MTEMFDAVILGMGPGGELVAGRLLGAGKKVAVVERELLGGECAYWACIPSKTLLRPPEVKSEATRAFGTGTPELDLESIFDYIGITSSETSTIRERSRATRRWAPGS